MISLLRDLAITIGIIYGLLYLVVSGWEIDLVKSEKDPGCCMSTEVYEWSVEDTWTP